MSDGYRIVIYKASEAAGHRAGMVSMSRAQPRRTARGVHAWGSSLVEGLSARGRAARSAGGSFEIIGSAPWLCVPVSTVWSIWADIGTKSWILVVGTWSAADAVEVEAAICAIWSRSRASIMATLSWIRFCRSKSAASSYYAQIY